MVVVVVPIVISIVVVEAVLVAVTQIITKPRLCAEVGRRTKEEKLPYPTSAQNGP